MAIKNGDIVKVEYEGTFDDGEVFDSTASHDDEPLEFKVGAQQVVPGFDASLVGKEVGQEFSIKLAPKDAYGEYNPEAVDKVPRDQFPKDVDIKVGMILGIRTQHGDHFHDMPVVVKEVTDDSITLDFNHPLAGKNLNFKIKVVDVIQA